MPGTVATVLIVRDDANILKIVERRKAGTGLMMWRTQPGAVLPWNFMLFKKVNVLMAEASFS